MKKVILVHLWLVTIGFLFYAFWNFIAANPEGFQLRLFNWRLMEFPIGWIVLCVFLLGFTLSFLIFLTYGSSLFLDVKRLRRENSSLQRMLDRQLAPKASDK